MIGQFLHRLCEMVTRRGCRERAAEVAAMVARARQAHAIRLMAHRKLDKALSQLREAL